MSQPRVDMAELHSSWSMAAKVSQRKEDKGSKDNKGARKRQGEEAGGKKGLGGTHRRDAETPSF